MSEFFSDRVISKYGSNFIVFLIMLFLAVHCLPDRLPNILPIIDIENNVNNFEKIFLSQFSDKVRYVPLESNPDNLIAWTYGIYCEFTNEYILDSNGEITILYDNGGQYIRQIGQHGKGPGEYSGTNYVTLINKKIYIYDYLTDDIVEYELDGTFTNRVKSGFTAINKYRLRDAILLNDSLIFGNLENYSGKEEYKALLIDKSGDIKNYYRNNNFFKLESGVPRAQALGGRAIIYRFGDKIYFKEPFNDTLFHMDDQYRLIPTFVFKLGKYQQPLSERGRNWLQIDLSSYITLRHAYQTNELFILVCNYNKYFPNKRISPEIINLPGLADHTYSLWYNSTDITGIYYKREGVLIFSEPTSTDNHLFTTGIYNDIDAGPRFIPDKMINDSTMVMKIKFDRLIKHIKSDDFKSNIPIYSGKKKELELLVDSLINSDYDNPVYMVVTFNKSNFSMNKRRN